MVIHQFLDERSTAVYGPSQGTRFEQEASLRMMPANVPSLPPNAAPNPVSMTPTYSGSPAFGASYGTQQIPPTNQPVSDREPSGSRLPPVPNLNLIGRSTGEQAVIVALQAVANYPNSSDFVRAVEQRNPGLANYLQAAAQPSGCETPTTLAETASMDTETIAGPSSSTTAAPSGSIATGPREEAGRKRVTGESAAPVPHWLGDGKSNQTSSSGQARRCASATPDEECSDSQAPISCWLPGPRCTPNDHARGH